MSESEFTSQWSLPWSSYEGYYRTDGFLSDIFGTDDVSEQDIENVRGDGFNYRLMRRALNSFRRKAHSRPKLNGYPPAVFLSYRWENTEAKRWVQQLAHYVRSRGFKVFLDQEHVPGDCRLDDLRVSRFVANLAYTHIALIVITDARLESETRLWLTEENQVSALEAWHGRLTPILLLKSSTETPGQWRRPIVVDLRADPADFSHLDSYLTYTGPHLKENEEEEIRSLLLEVEDKFKHREYLVAEQMLRQRAGFAMIPECRLALGFALGGQGRRREAFELATGLLPELQRNWLQPEFRVNLSFLFKALAEPMRALEIILPMRFTTGGLRGLICGLAGDILDETGALQSAINHYLRGLQLTTKHSGLRESDGRLLNDLGLTFMRLHEYRMACVYLRDAVRLLPLYPNAFINLLISLAYSGKRDEFTETAALARERVGHDNRISEVLSRSEEMLLMGALPSGGMLELLPPRIQCDNCGSYFESLAPAVQVCTTCGEYGKQGPCRYCQSTEFFTLDDLAQEQRVKCPICGKNGLHAVAAYDPFKGFEHLANEHEGLVEKIVDWCSNNKGQTSEERWRDLLPPERNDLAQAVWLVLETKTGNQYFIDLLGLEAVIFAKRLHKCLEDPDAYLKIKEQTKQALSPNLFRINPGQWRYKHSGGWTAQIIFDIVHAASRPELQPELMGALACVEGKGQFCVAVQQIMAGGRDPLIVEISKTKTQ